MVTPLFFFGASDLRSLNHRPVQVASGGSEGQTMATGDGHSLGAAGGVATDPMVEALMGMGFTRAQCEKAVKITNNRGVEPAMEWILANPDDDGSAPAAAGATSGPSA